MRRFTVIVALLLVPFRTFPAAEKKPNAHHAWMHRVADFTHMWWAEGFPSHTPSAPWRRCIQTGHYALVLDTQTLRIPHFGTIDTGKGYLGTAATDNTAWQALPPAELALTIRANGKTYACTAGGRWTPFTGPRLIASGRFMQQADVTDLTFTATDGSRLNVEARFETAAWPDRLGLILAARPGLLQIPPGEPCFGRVGGGFGLDGTNHLEIQHSRELDPERFTLELWTFVPKDYQPSKRSPPWLVCKNRHEHTDGNYGMTIQNGTPQATLNIGGGPENRFWVEVTSALQTEAWHHLAMSYDGNTLRMFINGKPAGERHIGRKRLPGKDGLAFGRRQDNCGDGFHFRGVIDEIRLYDCVLEPAAIRARFSRPETELPEPKPVLVWSFSADNPSSLTRPSETWRDAALDIGLTTKKGTLHRRWTLSENDVWSAPSWREVFLALDPTAFKDAPPTGAITVRAMGFADDAPCPVDDDAARGWHRINLDGIHPVNAPGHTKDGNDAIERVRLVLTNPDTTNRTARLLLEKNVRGMRLRQGTPITGISAILRDSRGNPTGLPVQLSKNWHTRPEAGVYAGKWFHGFTQVHLPPRATVEFELTLAYGHWGGVPAASHAQLCLIGWGSNQLWDESALGSWGESICYEPDQAQGHCAILDVRPVMVASIDQNRPWGWTHNVGGGDFFRMFDSAGARVFPARMRTAYVRHGPCLTEVTYAGRTGTAITHTATVSLGRSDDLLRGTYRLRMDVHAATEFSRFVILQIGADTYSYAREREMAIGNENGLQREWATRWGGNTYRTQPIECQGRIPWISLHQALTRVRQGEQGASANRGLVIRAWDARVGGRPAAPWAAERGVNARGLDTSTIDLVPPPGINRLEAGDFVDAVVEHIVLPQFAVDYYGPNRGLREALNRWENTWRMMHREATGNDRRIEVQTGTLETVYPAVGVHAANGMAAFTLSGGIGYVPITFSGLLSYDGCSLSVDGELLDQSVHGRDFWQTDYDPRARLWSLTYNMPVPDSKPREIRFSSDAQQPRDND